MVVKVVYSVALQVLTTNLPLLGKSIADYRVMRNISNQVRFKVDVMKSWP
jgi:hypothetical protein